MSQCQHKTCESRAREKLYLHGSRLESVMLCARHTTDLLERGIVHREPPPMVKLQTAAPLVPVVRLVEPVQAQPVRVVVEQPVVDAVPASVVVAPPAEVRLARHEYGVCVIRLCRKTKIQARGLCASHYNRAMAVLDTEHKGVRTHRDWATAIAVVQEQPPVVPRPVMVEPHPEMARVIEAHAARADLAAALGVGTDVALCDLVSMAVMRLATEPAGTPTQGSQRRYRVQLTSGRDPGIVLGRVTEDGALITVGGVVYGPRAVLSIEPVEEAGKRRSRAGVKPERVEVTHGS